MSDLALVIPDDAWDAVGAGSRVTVEETRHNTFMVLVNGSKWTLMGVMRGLLSLTDATFATRSDAWAAFGEAQDNDEDAPESQPWHRLNTLVTVNGLLFHADAWAIVPGSNPQEAYEGDDDLEAIHDAVHASEPMDTITIRGREYVVVLTPVC